MKTDRTIYYTDPLNDDFAGTRIHTQKVPADYPYEHANFLWNAAAFFLYRLIVTPIASPSTKID